MAIVKDEIGVIICECCEEYVTCKVYECKYLKKVEKAIYDYVKKATKK